MAGSLSSRALRLSPRKSAVTWLGALAVLFVGSLGWAAPATAAGSGTAIAQAASVQLRAEGAVAALTSGATLSASTPRVTAPGTPGTASRSTGLDTHTLGAASAVWVLSTTATRSDTGTSAQSHVDQASVIGFGTSLLTAQDIESSVSCPSGLATSAQVNTHRVTIGASSVNAAAGASAIVPVAIAGLQGATVTAQVSAPRSTGPGTASASGLVVELTLRATVPATDTVLNVPLGTVALAHSECAAPNSPSQGGTSPASPPAVGPGTDQSVGTPGDEPSNTPVPVPSAGDPHVLVVVPDQGPTAGGQQITINGSDFAPDATVEVGGGGASSVEVSPSGTSIVAVMPPGDAGPADVTVTQSSGSVTLPNGYTYVPPGAPLIDRIEPADGPIAGGQTVTVLGEGFTAHTVVTIDGEPATDVRVLSPRALTAVTPAHDSGPVTVVLSNEAGSSATRQYTYLANAAPCLGGGIANSSAVTYGGLGIGTAAIIAFGIWGALKAIPRLRRQATGL
jgi:hypothetical protein